MGKIKEIETSKKPQTKQNKTKMEILKIEIFNPKMKNSFDLLNSILDTA